MILFIVFLCYPFNAHGTYGHVFAFIADTGNLCLPPFNVVQNMALLGECSMCNWKECIFFFFETVHF